MQELRVNLRTAHGQAIGVRCSLLVLRILVANEPHTLQQDDDDKMPMPARTLYFTPSGDAHELLADGLFAALVLDLPASLRGSNWINASEPYLRPVQKAGAPGLISPTAVPLRLRRVGRASGETASTSSGCSPRTAP